MPEDDSYSGPDFPANEGEQCVDYKCVPSDGAGTSESCPSGEVKRCAEFK